MKRKAKETPCEIPECNNLCTTRYCSHKCAGIAKRGGKWSRSEMITLTCAYCGKVFERSKHVHTKYLKRGTKRSFCCMGHYLAQQQKDTDLAHSR